MRHAVRFLAQLLLLAAGCRSAPDAAGADPASTAPPPAAASAAASAPGAGPQAALDRLDARVPVPLLPMMANHQKQSMRDHLVAVQEIVAAAAVDDFDAVAASAKRIGYSEQMGAMCEHMGAAAPGFTEQALAFHRQADAISAAARRRDGKAVLGALSATMATCTGCHATFKQQVVDEATFAAVGAPAPQHHPEP
jgi:hypothetical protein